jgi:hypothetical protein
MKNLLSLLFLFVTLCTSAQTSYGSFSVGGNSGSYYPVLFSVAGVVGPSSLGKISIYISNVHANGTWSGCFHSDIEFISSSWGHMDSKIASMTYITGNGSPYNDPIGDVIDGSNSGGGSQMVIWLKGGATYQWSTTLNSQVYLIDSNPGGTVKTSASGNTLNIITSQSQLILNSKNNRYHQSVGLGTRGNGYFGGNVGIGTTSPLTPLDVKTTTNQHVQIVANTHGAYSGAVGIVSINDANTAYTPLGFYASNYYFGNGNVGIGTTNPDQKLTVNGKIHAQEVIVDLNVPADYVFAKDYTLMPLQKVEQYVQQNSHLPEIPSAAEVKQQGLSIGEMQNKLLQKVEELTLYAIQQNKKIEAMEKRIKELEAK